MEMRRLVSLDAVANQLEEDLLRRNISIVFSPHNMHANYFYLDLMETVVKSFLALGLMEWTSFSLSILP